MNVTCLCAFDNNGKRKKYEDFSLKQEEGREVEEHTENLRICPFSKTRVQP